MVTKAQVTLDLMELSVPSPCKVSVALFINLLILTLSVIDDVNPTWTELNVGGGAFLQPYDQKGQEAIGTT